MRKLKISHFLEKEIQSLLRSGLFCKILTLWAYNFGIVQRKNPIFIKDSVKQIKKYGYRVKNRSYLQLCPAKPGFLDVTQKIHYN
jgi:hypothetical protein